MDAAHATRQIDGKEAVIQARIGILAILGSVGHGRAGHSIVLSMAGHHPGIEEAVAPKNIQAWSGLSLMDGPGPWAKAPRYSPKPATNSTIAPMSIVEPLARLRLHGRTRKLLLEHAEVRLKLDLRR